ncbi:MAG: phosphopantothenoylcysteine decarboxylase [Candidatus Omnitrophica bacterium]|nr:phosphopantothenoylcysteine decarboxylase [Candidatus Omnitrophota bacterium]
MPRKNAKRCRILVTAGPTREWLDPVRFITNPSTGVMGYEIARAAKRAGHAVTLLSGPTVLKCPPGIRFIPFETTEQLEQLLGREFGRHDVLFMTAAVGDYTPVYLGKHKIKRRSTLTVRFKQTPDLLAKLSRVKKNQIIVGFCLETEHLAANAVRKLRKKNLDFIVANYLGNGTQPFGSGLTNVIVISKSGWEKEFNKITKSRLARQLLRCLCREPF